MVRRLSVVVVLAGLAVAVGVAPASAAPVRLSGVKVAPKDGGGEPSIASGPEGNIYVSYPAGSGMDFYRSFDGGHSWSAGAIAQSASGDTSLNVDSSGAVYQGNLNGGQ